ncbi:DNA repair protein RecO [Pseudohaliea rubra]|uniref:DNA repair protein RecO n=1 Tax=Pseudohaliea rubra DSM 19751 TaxID=1265313 RepID=A0A095X306_9GAMM|nr:DNA repair protein RecO [Pseudohaliea rubra]KGE05254.1 DNA recombination and repair protein RecO [Pseudohaliea rubra DSM 19751]
MQASLQPAYLLHRRPYRESSQLLELFTAEHGRVGVVARGLRRRSRGGSPGALLQPFSPLLVGLVGRGELKTLAGVESGGGLAPLRGDALLSGLYVNELLVRLLHRDDPQPAVFASYATVLGALADAAPVEPALRRFEGELLEALGYAFALDHDALAGTPVEATRRYIFEPGVGLRAQRPGAAGTSFAGEDLLRAAAGDFTGSAGRAAKGILRSALRELLGERPLRSRQLFLRRRERSREGS